VTNGLSNGKNDVLEDDGDPVLINLAVFVLLLLLLLLVDESMVLEFDFMPHILLMLVKVVLSVRMFVSLFWYGERLRYINWLWNASATIGNDDGISLSIMDSTEISNNVAAVIDNEDFAMVDATTDLVSTWLAASIYVTTFINPQYHLLQRDTININIDDHFFYEYYRSIASKTSCIFETDGEKIFVMMTSNRLLCVCRLFTVQ